MIPNHLTPPDLLGLTGNDIAALPAAELARLQHDSEDALRKAKAVIAWLESALLLKYGERARAARLEAEKDFGTTRFADGEVDVVADLPKRIDWDQRELAQLVERLKAEGEDPRDYVEISFKVAERKYTSWPSHIRKVFEPARTVRAGTQCFRLIVEKEDAQ
jgi:hypothetical protein